jgi:hypothetical protein
MITIIEFTTYTFVVYYTFVQLRLMYRSLRDTGSLASYGSDVRASLLIRRPLGRPLAVCSLLAGLLLTQRCDGSIPRLRLAAGWPAAHPEMRWIDPSPASGCWLARCSPRDATDRDRACAGVEPARVRRACRLLHLDHTAYHAAHHHQT